MTTAALKKKIVTAINQEEDKGLLEFIYAVLSEKSSGKRISKKQYNKELDAVTEELKKGKFITHESLVAEAKKWISSSAPKSF